MTTKKDKSETKKPGVNGDVGDDHEKIQLWKDGPYWATTNIGAGQPWEYGDYFVWGDVNGYKREGDAWVDSWSPSAQPESSFLTSFSLPPAGDIFDDEDYGVSFEDAETCCASQAKLESEGWISAEGILVSSHDVARMAWGGRWRMPTVQEFDDLVSKCDWIWKKMNGIEGYVARGKGDYSSSSIFLPAAGFGSKTELICAESEGRYWSSVPKLSDDGWTAYGLVFDSSSKPYTDSGCNWRFLGLQVRPVQGLAK